MYKLFNIHYRYNLKTRQMDIVDITNIMITENDINTYLMTAVYSGFSRPYLRSYDGITYEDRKVISILMYLGSLSHYYQIITKV